MKIKEEEVTKVIIKTEEDITMLLSNSKVKYLKIDMDSDKELTVKLLANLKYNANIISLDLKALHLASEERAAKVIAELLENNKSIINLNLANNDIQTREFSILINAVKMNNTLRYIDLSHNQLVAQNINLLLEVLKANSSIVEFDIRYNSLGVHPITTLVNGLSDHLTVDHPLLSFKISEYTKVNGSSAHYCLVPTPKEKEMVEKFQTKGELVREAFAFIKSTTEKEDYILDIASYHHLFLYYKICPSLKRFLFYEDGLSAKQNSIEQAIKNITYAHSWTLFGICKSLQVKDSQLQQDKLHISELPPEVLCIIMSFYCLGRLGEAMLEKSEWDNFDVGLSGEVDG